METSKLSEYFSIACERIHVVIDELYEALHTDEGEPLMTSTEVEEAMDGVRNAVYQELDLIKSIVKEYECEQ